jgi:hypothetical protein
VQPAREEAIQDHLAHKQAPSSQDAIEVVIAELDDMPSSIIIHWPPQASTSLEGRRRLLERLVGSLHLEPATRQRQRHFDMERIPDRYRLDPGDWDVVMESGREYVPVGEREDNPPAAWIPADEPIVLAEGERERLGLDSEDEDTGMS